MKAEKQLFLDEMSDLIQRSPAILLMSYQGVDSNAASDFRNLILHAGGFFYVAKKRIFIKAAGENGFSLNRGELQGHLGVVYTGDDPILSTKALVRFKEEGRGKIDILGGFFEGVFYSPQEVEGLAKLPSPQQLRAAFLGLFEGSISQVLAVMEAVLVNVLHCVENKIKKEEI